MTSETEEKQKNAKSEKEKEKEKKKKGSSVFSVSCFASVFMVFYMFTTMVNLYQMMYPLERIEIAPGGRSVKNWWPSQSPLYTQIYLSSQPKFRLDATGGTATLLQETPIVEGSLQKSFVLCLYDECDGKQDALDWLEAGTGIAAGEGIESTSVLLLAYEAVTDYTARLARLLGFISDTTAEQQALADEQEQEKPVFVTLPHGLWKSLHSNSTLYLHVLVSKESVNKTSPEGTSLLEKSIRASAKAHSVLLGKIDCLKFDPPHHITKPGRYLIQDIQYLLGLSKIKPWDFAVSQPEYWKVYQTAQHMKQNSMGYPYWKPEVSVKYIYDEQEYPMEYAHVSGMELIRVASRDHPSNVAMMPALYVDEIGLTSEKYIPVNETVAALPLRISLDRSDITDTSKRAKTATAGAVSPARWRLLSHLSQALEAQKELGFEDSDIDDLRRLIADTNVALLGITVLASGLHLLFEFLTFKNEVSFWNSNKDLTGLSVRSLFLDFIGQVIILLYLIEKDSSLLMTIPSACGCAIALWKCQRGAGFAVQKTKPGEKGFLGYSLVATRLIQKEKVEDPQSDLHTLTLEMDRLATQRLGSLLIPLVVIYTFYSLLYELHVGWYSWLITCASSAVYALGFALMTPQLFLNYKLKSVAHLPWRVLVYKFLNTFIDDLFAFIIRMPTMARLSCFRDDIVFIIYLYQRWLYPVDQSRPVEGGGVIEPTEQKKKSE